MRTISKFVNRLCERSSNEVVFNPYQDDRLAINLEKYLQFMKSEEGNKILLVGEAPGYAGCKMTGIPFTSGQAICKIDHSLLIKLRDVVSLRKVESEKTATIVWEYLAKKESTPLLWNSFPFHPHPLNSPEDNRAPTNAEVEEGVSYLRELFEIFKPTVIAGLGRAGERCSKLAFKDKSILYIHHPSRGGKSKFIEGMDGIII